MRDGTFMKRLVIQAILVALLGIMMFSADDRIRTTPSTAPLGAEPPYSKYTRPQLRG